MARNEVAEKLRIFLQNPQQNCTNEQGAMYLMVQLRKLIDFEYSQDTTMKSVKFYCDWLVHSRKDRHISDIETTVNAIYDSCLKNLTDPETNPHAGGYIQALLLFDLSKNMTTLFNKYGFSTDLIFSSAWMDFYRSLIKILSEQPIQLPSNYPIRQLVLIYSPEDDISLEAIFANPIVDFEGVQHSSYKKDYHFPMVSKV